MADGANPQSDTVADAPDAAAFPAESPATESPATPDKKPGRLRAGWNLMWKSARRKADITWKFTKELFNDHTFWVKALAVKGGASAILVTGIVGISAAMSMPLLIAATGITLSVGLIGVSLYGMAAGGIKAWEGLQDVYARATGRAPKEHVYKETEDMFQRLARTDTVKRITQHKWAQKLAKTHAWKTTAKFTRNREDSVLGGIAVGGAALSLVVGAVALPFVAVGSLLTVATVFTISSVISGVSGLYFSITGLREESRLKREHRAKLKAAQAAPKLDVTDLPPIGLPFIEPPRAGAKAAEVKPGVTTLKPLVPPFEAAAQVAVAGAAPAATAANTNLPPVPKSPANSAP